MPWTVADVDKHKKGLTASQKKQWVAIANSALHECMATKQSEKVCAPKAIRMASGSVGKKK